METEIQLMICPKCNRTWLVEQSKENSEMWLLFEHPHIGENTLVQAPLDLEDIEKLVLSGEFMPKYEMGKRYSDFVIAAIRPICPLGCGLNLEELYMWSLN